ncbi:uncharacterized protein LOC144151786 isoform X1 [Haemaphysalis longicornis]
MADVSAASLPCFSLDEKTLQLLWDEGIQMEQLLDFSFERIGRLAAERGVHLDDSHKEELWLFIERMKEEQSDWLTLSKLHDRTSRQLYGSCLDFTCLSSQSRFHTARQLSWEELSLDESAQTSFLRASPATTVHVSSSQADALDGDLPAETAPTKRPCKIPKTFRLSRCDLSPISPKARTPRRRSRSKMVALLGRLVPDRMRGSQADEDRFFTRGIWPAWLTFTATPKQSSPTAPGVGRSCNGTRRHRLPSFLRWIGRQRSRGYRVSTVRQRP